MRHLHINSKKKVVESKKGDTQLTLKELFGKNDEEQVLLRYKVYIRKAPTKRNLSDPLRSCTCQKKGCSRVIWKMAN
jgi:hypothetical protein